MSGNPIPTRVRRIVHERDAGHCLRCGGGGDLEIHHRRRRGVRGLGDPHGLDVCVSLCRVCHNWVHAHPLAGREAGFLVSSYEPDCASVPLTSFMGQVLLEVDGGIRWA